MRKGERQIRKNGRLKKNQDKEYLFLIIFKSGKIWYSTDINIAL